MLAVPTDIGSCRVRSVDGWLAQLFDPIAAIDALAATAEEAIAPPDTRHIRAVITECRIQLARYSAALDAGAAAVTG